MRTSDSPASARSAPVQPTRPPTLPHASALSLTKPVPLHSFWPAQALLAVLQSLRPLHAFAPWHITFAEVAPLPLSPVAAQPATSNAAALAAIASPASLLPSVIVISSNECCLISRGRTRHSNAAQRSVVAAQKYGTFTHTNRSVRWMRRGRQPCVLPGCPSAGSRGGARMATV